MWSFIYSDCWMFAIFNFILILYSKRRLIWLKTIKRWDYWRMSRRLDSTTDPSLCLRRSPFERQMVLRAAAQHRTIFFVRVFVCGLWTTNAVSKYCKCGDWERESESSEWNNKNERWILTTRICEMRCIRVELTCHNRCTCTRKSNTWTRSVFVCGCESASFSLMCGRCMRVQNQPMNYLRRQEWSSPRRNMNNEYGSRHMSLALQTSSCVINVMNAEKGTNRILYTTQGHIGGGWWLKAICDIFVPDPAYRPWLIVYTNCYSVVVNTNNMWSNRAQNWRKKILNVLRETHSLWNLFSLHNRSVDIAHELSIFFSSIHRLSVCASACLRYTLCFVCFIHFCLVQSTTTEKRNQVQRRRTVKKKKREKEKKERKK